MSDPTREELAAAKAALERMAKRKPQNAAIWARYLAPQFVKAGIEYDRQFIHTPPKVIK